MIGSPNEVVTALCIVSAATPHAIGRLHSLHYHWDSLDRFDREHDIADARAEIERALASIIKAQDAISRIEQPEAA